jgi:hypothetical protein
MSSDDAKDRKRTPMKISEAVSINVGGNPNEESNKARRASTNASASNAAPLQVVTPATTEKANTASAASAAAVNHEESIQISIGKIIQDLFHSNNDKVNATLTALDHDFMKDKKKCECFVTAGGCHALVQLLKNYLKKKIDEIPAYEQVTDLNKLAELSTLDNTLSVIIRLTFQHAESRSSISAIGGVEAVAKVMKAFPKCQALQLNACTSLRNLALCSIGKANAIESGGIDALLAAINNHLVSAILCREACWAL